MDSIPQPWADTKSQALSRVSHPGSPLGRFLDPGPKPVSFFLGKFASRSHPKKERSHPARAPAGPTGGSRPYPYPGTARQAVGRRTSRRLLMHTCPENTRQRHPKQADALCERRELTDRTAAHGPVTTLGDRGPLLALSLPLPGRARPSPHLAEGGLLRTNCLMGPEGTRAAGLQPQSPLPAPRRPWTPSSAERLQPGPRVLVTLITHGSTVTHTEARRAKRGPPISHGGQKGPVRGDARSSGLSLTHGSALRLHVSFSGIQVLKAACPQGSRAVISLTAPLGRTHVAPSSGTSSTVAQQTCF